MKETKNVQLEKYPKFIDYNNFTEEIEKTISIMTGDINIKSVKELYNTIEEIDNDEKNQDNNLQDDNIDINSEDLDNDNCIESLDNDNLNNINFNVIENLIDNSWEKIINNELNDSDK